MLRTQETCYGCLSFYPAAIEGALRLADWEEVERYVTALRHYTRDEPLPWADFFIGYRRALIAFGRGNRDDDTIQKLKDLRDAADQIGAKFTITSLEAALSSV